MLLTDVVGLVGDGCRVFVGPEDVAVEEPRGLRERIAVDGGFFYEAEDVAVGLIAADADAFLEEAVVGFGNLMPAVAVEGQTYEELVGGDTCVDDRR